MRVYPLQMKAFSRFLTICKTLFPVFLIYSLTRSQSESKRFKNNCVAIRVAFQQLGVTFIKLGQLLSARPDIIGLELASELRNLLDHETILSFSTIEEVIETETKKPYQKIFKKIEHTPIDAASIAQVHKAVLLSGKHVAIKIQRPHVEKAILEDLLS